MKVNQKAEKSAEIETQLSHPQASRPAPRIEQKSAREAGAFRVLPIEENGILYSVMSVPMHNAAGEVHYAIACDNASQELWRTQFYSREYIPHLETDVQHLFIVDLFVTDLHVCIKPEHGNIIAIDKHTGQLSS